MPRIRSVAIGVAIPIIAAVAALFGQGPNSPDGDLENDPAARVTFADVFAEVGRVRVEGSADEPIGGITGLAFDRRGRIAVADRQSDRVFVFRPNGDLQRIVGRSGEGPGEFDGPTDVAFGHDGRLYVSEAGGPRITRYDAGLAFDTVLHLGEAYYAMQLSGAGGNLLAYVNAPGLETPRLRLIGGDGREINRFHPSHPAYIETPYWSAATDRILAASNRWIVAGGNLIYPLAVYARSGTFIDSVGSGPERWRQAPRPERGAFQGPDQLRQFEKWRRSFTTIQNIAVVRDRYLVVSHQSLDPDILAYEDAEYFADVYDLTGRTKLWTGIDLPGPLLAGGEALTLLLGKPPGGWVLGRYGIAE